MEEVMEDGLQVDDDADEEENFRAMYPSVFDA